MSDTEATTLKRKRALHRRVVMIAFGSGLGLFCRFAPPQHQELCHWAARVLGLFLGSP